MWYEKKKKSQHHSTNTSILLDTNDFTECQYQNRPLCDCDGSWQDHFMIISEHRQNMTVVQTVKVTKHLFPESINPELSPAHKNHLSLNPIISSLDTLLQRYFKVFQAWVFQGSPSLKWIIKPTCLGILMVAYGWRVLTSRVIASMAPLTGFLVPTCFA